MEWSNSARVAEQYFYRALQPLELYFEDKKKEFFYTVLIRRICGEKFKYAKVTCLGNCTDVIKFAKEKENDPWPKLFVIDGDYDYVLGVPPPLVRNLHRLNAYCIENLLIADSTFAHVLSSDECHEYEEALKRVDTSQWIEEYLPSLVELAVHFALVKRFRPQEATVGSGHGRFLDDSVPKRKGQLSLVKIQAEIQRLSIILDSCATPAQLKECRQIIEAVKSLSHSELDILSGKDILLPIMFTRLRNLGCNLHSDNGKVRLANNACPERFKELKLAIQSA